MKVVENSPQNARNCTILKNFLGESCPQTPLATARSFAARDMPFCGRYIQLPKKILVGPPLRNPAYAPDMIALCLRGYGQWCSGAGTHGNGVPT